MDTAASPDKRRIDHFFSAPSARLDRWRDLHAAGRSWASGDGGQGAAEATLEELGVTEEFYAFPGPNVIDALPGTPSR